MIQSASLSASGPAQILFYSTLLACYTLAALHNVTVDDAITTGAVVLQYSPQGSWNIGNNCTICLVKPDPSLAYNRTWHDITFSSVYGYTPTIEVSYTGSSVYIFFILANNVPGATTNTNVDFVMDGTHVGTYNHTPSNSSDYEYNVPVYVNNSVTQGLHSLVIQPVTSLNANVLILFDYLIYTTDTDSSSSVSLPVTSAVLPSTNSSAHTRGAGSNIGAIAGGTVGGIVAVALLAAFLLCYWRRTRHDDIRPFAEEGDVADPFTLTREVASTPPLATPIAASTESPSANPMSSSKMSLSTLTLQTPTIAPSSSGASSSNNATLHEQVELLREQLAHLWRAQFTNRNDTPGLPADAPPEYSI